MSEPARYSYDKLDRIIHERARLGLLTGLMGHPHGLLFTELKELCGLTDGNLNRHLRVLEEAGLVEVWKGHNGKRPQTLCRMTPFGREKFGEYLRELESVIADALAASRFQASAEPGPGWAPV